jgi:PhzF family phenazine biosynthesis protein
MSVPTLPFRQVDVFSATPGLGNPVAVVHDAASVPEDQMARFARWTNLSETVFLVPPSADIADYGVRIWTPGGELPFAGHPTIGAAHAWLEAGGKPRQEGTVVQECGVGLVPLQRREGRLAFRAPPLRRTGAVDAADLDRVVRSLGIDAADVITHQWVDNGPGWLAVMLPDANAVLALRPDFVAMGTLQIGVVGRYAGRSAPGEPDLEVRAFCPSFGPDEDPVTGSLNAGVAQWLIGAGLAPPAYTVSQGTILGRRGRVYVVADRADVWVGGDAVTCIRGEVRL